VVHAPDMWAFCPIGLSQAIHDNAYGAVNVSVKNDMCDSWFLACQKHAPANNGYQEIACLGNKLEGPVEVKQCEDVLQTNIKLTWPQDVLVTLVSHDR